MSISTSLDPPPQAEEKPIRLGEALRMLLGNAEEHSTIGEVLDKVDRSSFGLLLILFSLPTALPMTPPGVTLPFAIIIAILGVQMMRGRHTPWLPERVRRRPLVGRKLAKIAGFIPGFIEKFERRVKARWTHLVEGETQLRWTGMTLLVAAIAMAFPLPLTNSIAATGIVLVGLGLMHRDGMFSMAGMTLYTVTAIVNISLLVGALIWGPQVLGPLLPPFIAERLG